MIIFVQWVYIDPQIWVTVSYPQHPCGCHLSFAQSVFAPLDGTRSFILKQPSMVLDLEAHPPIWSFGTYMYRSREKSWDSLNLDRSSDGFAHHYYAYTPGYPTLKASHDLLVVRLPKRVYYTWPLRGHWLLLRATTQRMSNAKLHTLLRSY
jgi:hypothetical protein